MPDSSAIVGPTARESKAISSNACLSGQLHDELVKVLDSAETEILLSFNTSTWLVVGMGRQPHRGSA